MKNKEEPSNEQVQIQKDARGESHEVILHEFVLAPDQACVDSEEFQSRVSSSSFTDAEVSGTTGKTFRKPSC